MPWQVFLNGFVAGSVYALVALGFGLIFRICKFFHLAHGAIYTLGAYAAYSAASGGLPSIPACCVGILASVALGLTIEIAAYRPLRSREATPSMMLIASLGIYLAVQNTFSLFFGDMPLRLRSGPVVEGLQIAGAHLTNVQIATAVSSLFLTFLTWFILRRTRAGRITRAVALDSDLSQIVGINVNFVMLSSILAASALAAVAAIQVGYDTDITPAMGFNALLLASVAVLIGGIESVWGAYFGGLLIGAIQSGSALILPTQWQDTTVFVVMIISLLLRPRGFVGARSYSTQG